MADGYIKISSRIDNSKAKQDFKDLQHLIEEYGEESQTVLGMELEKIVNKHDEVSASMERNIDTIQDLEFEIENLQSVLQAHNTGKEVLDDEMLARARSELSLARVQLEKASNEGVRLEKAMFDTTLQTERFKLKMDNVVERTNKTREATAGVRKEHERLNKTSSLGVGKLGRYAMALFSIRSVYGMLSKLSNQWLNSNTEAANQTKAQIEAMSSMASNMLAPVIQWLVNLASQLFGYFAALLKVLFKVDITAKKASKGTSEMASGAKATNKELKRMLAGFDEVEKVSSDTANNMGGGGGGADIGEVSTPDMDTSKFEKAINKMKGWLNELWNTATVRSYFDSFKRIGTAAFNSIKTIAGAMWDNVVLSWKEASPFIFEGLRNVVEYWRRVFEDIADVTEEWLPKITDKIVTLIDNIFATFRPLTTFAAQVWRDFTQIMLDLWNKYGKEILTEMAKFIDGAIEILNKIWTEILDPIIAPAIQFLKEMWEEHLMDLLITIGEAIGTLVVLALRILNEVIMPIISWLVDLLKPMVVFVWDFILDYIKVVLGALIDFIKVSIDFIIGVFEGLVNFFIGVFTGDWEMAWEGIKQIFVSIWDAIVGLLQIFFDVIIGHLMVFINLVVSLVENLWELIKVLISGASTAVVNIVKALWNLVINIFTNAFNTLTNVFNKLAKNTTGVFNTIFSTISNVLGNLKGIFNGLTNFISGVFTGNWKKAWQGVVSIFKNIISGIANIFKAPLNLMIDGLNIFIRGLNKIKIPKWVPGVGGKGIDITPIPKLQRGGIVNRPMPAMIGDGGKEAVIPLENDTRALEQIASMIAEMIGGGQGGDIVIQLGNETIFKAVIKELQKKQTQMNGGVVLGI